MALGDPSLVRRIERGRSLTLRTADRILAFISEHDGESRGCAGPASTPATRETDAADEEQRGGAGP